MGAEGDAAEQLLASGANPNVKDKQGRTALDHAEAEHVNGIMRAGGAK